MLDSFLENCFFVGGSLCNQFFCIVPFINNKLPFPRIISMRFLVSLCLKENLRSTPIVSDAIVPLSRNVFSLSLCQEIPSSLVRYKLSKQELYVASDMFSIFRFSCNDSGVQLCACLVSPEYL